MWQYDGKFKWILFEIQLKRWTAKDQSLDIVYLHVDRETSPSKDSCCMLAHETPRQTTKY